MGGFRQIALQAFGGFDAQRAQFLGAADEVAASLRELFVGLLELALRLVDVFADGLERLDEAGEFVVKPAAFSRDGEGVLVLLFVAPDVGDGAQGGEQRTRADRHDALVKTFLEQGGIVLQGEQVGRFDGDEHKHEVQRAHAFEVGIVFLRQAADVGADAGDVGGKFALGGCGVGGLGIADVGGQRDFGVDDDLFAFGQVDEDVGLEAARAVFFLADGGGLDGVFAPFLQAGMFQNAFQNHLAPVALGFVLRAGERVGEGFGVAVQLGVEGLQAFEFIFEGQPFARFFFVGLLNQLAEAVDAFVERGQQLAEVVAVLLGEAAAFLFQNGVGEVLELVAQALAGFGKELELFVGGEAFLFELDVEAFVADVQVVRVFLKLGVILFQTTCFLFALLKITDLAFGGGEAVAQFLQLALQILDMIARVGKLGGGLRLILFGKFKMLAALGKRLHQGKLLRLRLVAGEQPSDEHAGQKRKRGGQEERDIHRSSENGKSKNGNIACLQGKLAARLHRIGRNG